MGCRGVRLGLYGPRAPAPRGPCTKIKEKGESPKGGRHLRGALGRMDSSLAAPFLGGRAKAAPLSLGPIYSGGKGGQQHLSLGRLPPPLQHLSLSRRSSAKPCRRPATSTTTPSCCWISINLSFPLAGSRKEETSLHRTCVERGGAVRSALGHR